MRAKNGNIWLYGGYKSYQQNTATVENSKNIPIYSDGSNLTDYSFEGQCSQASTPTPSSPVEVEEFGERTGNLFFSKIESAGISSSGKIISDGNYTLYIARISQGQQYIGNGGVFAFYVNEPNINSVSYNNSRSVGLTSFTAPIDGYVAVRFNAGTDNAMLNEGSTALPYEPYGKYKIPVTSAGQTQNIILSEPLRKIDVYADTIDSEGVVTRRIKKLVLTGQESWEHYGSSVFWIKIEGNDMIVSENGLCNNYVYNPVSTSIPSSLSNGEFGLAVSSGRLYIKNTAYSYASDFKSYLAQQYSNGTPVIVYYVLATPTTESVTVPTIPTSSGFSNIEIGTSLAPSKFEYDLGKMFVAKGQGKVRQNGEWV